MPVLHHGVVHRPVQLESRLAQATHVLLRVDAVRKPLVAPYEGPFLVISRTPKTFILQRHEKQVTVSEDRLKPACVDLPAAQDVPAACPAPVPTPSPSTDPVTAPAAPLPVFTASGRISRPVQRLTSALTKLHLNFTVYFCVFFRLCCAVLCCCNLCCTVFR